MAPAPVKEASAPKTVNSSNDKVTTLSEKSRANFVLMIQNIDLGKFNNNLYTLEELKNHNIMQSSLERIFVNKHNNYLYICLSDEKVYIALNEKWPVNIFGGGTEVVKPKPKVLRHFVAIRGVEVSIDIEKNDNFKIHCASQGIKKLWRVIKKKDRKPIQIVKAEVETEEAFKRLFINGLKIENDINYLVVPWEFDNQPLQCFKCQRYGHHQSKCTSQSQRCPICAGNHKLSDCHNKADKSKIKCCNCPEGQNNHTALSRDCPKQKQASEAKFRITNKNEFSRVESPSNQYISYSEKVKMNRDRRNNNNNNNNFGFVAALVQLLSYLDIPNRELFNEFSSKLSQSAYV
jgi:hypothetical protein